MRSVPASGSTAGSSSGSDGTYALVLEAGDSIRLGSGTWTSSNSSVIKVNSKGKATAMSEGSATLTSSAGISLRVKVEEDD